MFKILYTLKGLSAKRQDITGAMITAAQLRSGIAQRQVRLYKLAAHVGLHPGRLGMMLNESIPMPQEIADRIQQALEAMDRENCGGRQR